MIPWESYEAFVAVVRYGSFTAAAKMLGVSKSMVSRRISGLEDRLGNQLLLRSTRSLTPTQLGQNLFTKSCSLFDSLHAIEREAIESDHVPKGVFRISALDFFGERYIAPIAAELARDYQELAVELHISTDQRGLIDAAYDVSILYDHMPSSSLVARRVFDLDHAVAASPGYLQRHGAPPNPEALQGHFCLVSTFEACSAWTFIIDGVDRDYALGGRWRSNSGSALIAAARTDLGLLRLPTVYLREYLDRGELVEVLTDYVTRPMPVWAVYAYDRHKSPALSAFLGLIEKRLKPRDPAEQMIGRIAVND